jgi:hypothetical protein
MNALKTAAIAILIGLVYGCSHPIEIVGEGDVLSATGTRNCYYEDFLAGAENCSKNLIVHEYLETYYAVPREGWEFDKWLNYCTNSNSDECAFNIPANVVKNSWGATVPPLVAVFAKTATPPPKPVAVYSYALDAAGNLLNPQPLEGAQLQRKSVYFSFTGEYSKATFWCCKVVGGTEPHMPSVTDDEAPFVLRVDLGALPADSGLERELCAHLFDANGDYQVELAHWTLEPPPTSPVIFNDGNEHTIDYTIEAQVLVTSRTTVNLATGANLDIIDVEDFARVNVNDGDVNLLWAIAPGGTAAIHGGNVGSLQTAGGYGDITGGNVNEIGMVEGILGISGGTIGPINIREGTVSLSGGTFNGGVNIIGPLSSLDISGGTFNAPFSLVTGSGIIFYGDLLLTKLEQGSYSIVGTLSDGSYLSQTITANCSPSLDCGISISP